MANKSLADWITARKRYGLSHAHVQIARELGMNPNKLGKLDNHDQEPWKVPLPQFIERLYLRRFGRERPESGPLDRGPPADDSCQEGEQACPQARASRAHRNEPPSGD
jgi:hypothetical protein